MRLMLMMFTCVGMAGCVDTVSEDAGTFTSRGETYDTTTRQFQRPDGSTYSRMTIYVGAERVTCIPNDREDCETALLDTFNRARSGF
ncbi:hypothetical protein [uncultured Tateyamaria sp.]|uniref:hypothetical protein n=1 Tax=uncultured Tateyamaria sp. TaxID=455651 RepID=UPI002631E124|nr:hypothetical protein [uncultured Tateyamaria sp.]